MNIILVKIILEEIEGKPSAKDCHRLVVRRSDKVRTHQDPFAQH